MSVPCRRRTRGRAIHGEPSDLRRIHAWIEELSVEIERLRLYGRGSSRRAAGTPRGRPAPARRPPAAGRCGADRRTLHLYARGGHGFGMVRQGPPSDDWIGRFYEWLRVQEMVGRLY